MMEKVINICYASNILLSCPPPLLKRACPTADARQNAKRAGSHAGGEGITCPPSFPPERIAGWLAEGVVYFVLLHSMFMDIYTGFA
jgi:hypothetical protein